MNYNKNILPTWNELLELHLVDNKELLDKVKALEQSPNRLMFKLGKLFCYLFLRDPTCRKYLQSSWAEVVDIVFLQVFANEQILKKAKIEKYDLDPVINKFCRKYRQWPCTLKTVKERVQMAVKICKVDDPILLLGDDDMVGLHLARAGFKNITVLDIDRKILKYIDKIAKQEKLPLNIFWHDLNNSPQKEMIKDYRLIYFDPFYSLEGLDLFLNSATKMTSNALNTHYFISIHLMSLLKSDFETLNSYLAKYNMEILQFYQSFNSYPVPSLLKRLMSLVISIVINSPVIRPEKKSFSFFITDALLLKQKKSFG